MSSRQRPGRKYRAARLLAAGAATACLGFAGTAAAAPSPTEKIQGKGGNLGVGLSVGDPTGASLKYFLEAKHAIQADLGFGSFAGHGRFGVDYLFHPGRFTSNETLDLVGYVGVGVGVGFWARRGCGGYNGNRYYDCRSRGGAGLFLRAPVLGLAFHWKKIPLDTVVEGSWAPYVVRPWLAHGDFSIKARYYF